MIATMTSSYTVFVLAALALVASVSGEFTLTCTQAGITDSSSCQAFCSGANFQYSTGADGGNCACFNSITFIDVCPQTSSGEVTSFPDAQGEDDDDFVPTIDNIRAGFVFLLGEECRPAINRAISSNDLLTCFEEISVVSSAFDPTSSAGLETICTNQCVGTVFRSISILADAGCLTASSFSDDDGLGSVLGLITSFEDSLQAMCTTSSSNNEYCGDLVGLLVGLSLQVTPVNATDCNTILDYGNCFGTLLRSFEVEGSIFSNLFFGDVNDLADSLIASCDAEGVTGLQSAAEGTEVPANLGSSSAASMTALFGAVAVIAAAALLA